METPFCVPTMESQCEGAPTAAGQGCPPRIICAVAVALLVFGVVGARFIVPGLALLSALPPHAVRVKMKVKINKKRRLAPAGRGFQ